MASIGQELRRERELRGIALSDIAKVTKIKLTSLQALEEDKLNLLPGEFFIKGMIRAYAKVVGLDEDQLLTLYEHSLQQRALDKVQEARKRETHILKSRRSHAPLIVLAAALVVAVTVFLLIGFGQKKGTRAEIPPADAQAPTGTRARNDAAPVSPAPTRVEAPVSTPAPEAAPPAAAPSQAQPAVLSLVIDTQQETWIQVKADGQVVLGRLLQPGERVSLACRKEFILDTGNAGGFTYTLNGRPGRSLGAPGAVIKNVRIGLDNLQDFLGAA
jgi:cytoskeleton protein RodZ